MLRSCLGFFIIGVWCVKDAISGPLMISYGTTTPAPAVIKVIEGQPFALTCSCDDPTAALVWSSDSELVSSVLGGRLRVPRAQRGHSGQYVCSQINATHTSVQMIVLYPSSLPKISGPSKVIQGSDVQLTCTAEGNPPPSYSWVLRGSGTRVAIGTELHKKNLNDHLHVGCEVQTTLVPTVGEAETSVAVAYHTVHILRKASVFQLYDDYWGQVNSTLDVECKVSADPEGLVYWTRTHDNWTFTGPRLIINHFTTKDAGNYTCHHTKTLAPSEGQPVPSTDRRSTRIRVYEAGNRWRCYFFNSSERIRLLDGNFPEGTDPERFLCEEHPGFVFNGGDYLRTPGCTPCGCCQKVSRQPLIQATSVVNDVDLVPAVAVGWGLAAILVVVLLCLGVKMWRISKQTTAPRVIPAARQKVGNETERREQVNGNFNQTRPLPRLPLPEQRHSYLELIEVTSDDGMVLVGESPTSPQSPARPGYDEWGYIHPSPQEH